MHGRHEDQKPTVGERERALTLFATHTNLFFITLINETARKLHEAGHISIFP
jgi:hypothetical protein